MKAIILSATLCFTCAVYYLIHNRDYDVVHIENPTIDFYDEKVVVSVPKQVVFHISNPTNRKITILNTPAQCSSIACFLNNDSPIIIAPYSSIDYIVEFVAHDQGEFDIETKIFAVSDRLISLPIRIVGNAIR